MKLNKKCLKCGKILDTANKNVKYCGNWRKKVGCSFKMRKERNKVYYSTPSVKHKVKIKKRESRKNNLVYKEKQKECCRNWAKNNKDKVLFLNRRKRNIKLNARGEHTEREWQELKRKTGFKKMGIGA